MLVDSDNARVIDELRKRRMDVIPLPFDGPIFTGGGMRCAHHPLLRESVLEYTCPLTGENDGRAVQGVLAAGLNQLSETQRVSIGPWDRLRFSECS